MLQTKFDNPRILQEWPSLKDKPCTFVSSNWGDVWLFDDHVVKSSQPGLEKIISKEIAIMCLIGKSNISLAPALLLSGNDQTFYSMEKKSGIELKYIFNFMSLKQKQTLAEQLADFKIDLENKVDTQKLKNLLRYPQRTKEYLQLPETRDEFESRGEGAHDLLLEYLEKINDRKPLPMHGDLHEQNILIDPVTKGLSGIIDWALAEQTMFYEHEFLRLRYADEGVIPKQFAQNVFDIYCSKSDHNLCQTDLSCYKIIYELEYNRQIYEIKNTIPQMYSELSDDILYLSSSAKGNMPSFGFL